MNLQRKYLLQYSKSYLGQQEEHQEPHRSPCFFYKDYLYNCCYIVISRFDYYQKVFLIRLRHHYILLAELGYSYSSSISFQLKHYKSLRLTIVNSFLIKMIWKNSPLLGMRKEETIRHQEPLISKNLPMLFPDSNHKPHPQPDNVKILYRNSILPSSSN